MLPKALHGRWSGPLATDSWLSAAEQPEYVAGNAIGYEDSPAGIVNVCRHVVQMISGSIDSLRKATVNRDPHPVATIGAPRLLTLTSPRIIEPAFIVDDGNTMVTEIGRESTATVLGVRITNHSAAETTTMNTAVRISTRRTVARSTERSASGGAVTPASSLAAPPLVCRSCSPDALDRHFKCARDAPMATRATLGQ